MSWQPPPPPPLPGQAPQPPAPAKPKAPQNYYQILQVDSGAHPTIIRYAYRFLAAQYHPDNADSGDGERFRIITEAWRTLSDAGKRQSYDIQIGLNSPQGQAQQQQAAGQGQAPPQYNVPKMSLSWSEVELRLAVLQVLMEARRKRVQTGGATGKMLMDCLNCTMIDLDFVLWYLREKGLVERTDRDFMITVAGVDYLIDQLTKTQPMNTGSASSAVQLPATL